MSRSFRILTLSSENSPQRLRKLSPLRFPNHIGIPKKRRLVSSVIQLRDARIDGGPSLMQPVRTFRMTISSLWYDKKARRAREYELHFRVARRGGIRNVRRHLARRGVPYFQRTIYRKYKRWIPKGRIKVRFEREEPARKVERTIQIEVRRMEGKGRQWKAYRMPSRVLSYAKKRRKTKR